MFIGHYGPAIWDAHRTDGVRLWHGFLGVQAMDLLASLLSIFGVEGGPLEGGHPLAFNVPFTHSLTGAILIAIAVAILYRFIRPSAGRKGAAIMGGLAFSHWPLDWLVHRPDLPILPFGDNYLGLGLWDYAWPAFGLELLLFGGMVAWWLSRTNGPRWTTICAWVFVAVMSAAHFFMMTKPTLDYQAGKGVHALDPVVFGVVGLITFTVMALIIRALETRRSYS